MPSAKHLDEDRIRALHAAAVRAGLTAHRAELLLGIDPSFTSTLAVSVSPSAQLLSDLFHLADVTLRDNSIPLVPWLENALGLTRAQEVSRFAPGELDEFLPDDRKLRLPDDYRFLQG